MPLFLWTAQLQPSATKIPGRPRFSSTQSILFIWQGGRALPRGDGPGTVVRSLAAVTWCGRGHGTLWWATDWLMYSGGSDHL